jgi:hypothetical protein
MLRILLQRVGISAHGVDRCPIAIAIVQIVSAKQAPSPQGVKVVTLAARKEVCCAEECSNAPGLSQAVELARDVYVR